MEIREARPNEYDEVGRATLEAYREFEGEEWDAYADRLADVAARAARALVLVAVEEGRILGTATLEIHRRIERGSEPLEPDEAHLRMVGVLPEARRRGIARALVDACARAALGHGKSRLTLHTTVEMTTARATYERLGFRRLPDVVRPSGFRLYAYERALGASDRRPGR